MESCNDQVSQEDVAYKSVIFTLHDGKLLVAPKKLPITFDTVGVLKAPSAVDLTDFDNQDELYIEIIRENVGPTQPNYFEEEPITNISSAYETFWKYDFQMCIERRTCTFCEQVVLTPLHLLHHWLHVHKTPHPVECFVCHKFFQNEETMKKHMLESHYIAQPEFICEVCLNVFSDEQAKNTHRLLHAQRSRCKWCSETFACNYLLNNHLQKCSLHKKEHDCHVCGCHFRSIHLLELHRLRHNRIICDVCESSLLSESKSSSEKTEIDLIRHLETNHTKDEIKNVLDTLKKQDQEEQTLDNLLMSEVQSSPNVVSSPASLVPTLGSMLPPVPSKHSITNSNHDLSNEKDNANVKDLQCRDCFKTFESTEELLTHDLEHQMPFCCNVCQEKFPHRRNFKKHMRSHGILVKPGSIKYKCKQCSVCCGTMSGLRTHFLTHTNQKLHLCDKCGLRFRRAQALRVHKNTVHSTRTLHTCFLCGSGSFSKPSLHRHMQCVHGGVRRFICGLCGTRFLQNQDLRKHLKRVHCEDLPPMETLSKKSNAEVHIIPSSKIENQSDPMFNVLKLAVKEEKLKLEALRGKKSQINLNSGVAVDRCMDGISLNILGDVASKAAPLEHSNNPSGILKQDNQEIQAPTKFLCAGCQYVSDALIDFSTHLAQCNQQKSIGLPETRNCKRLLSDKPHCFFAGDSTFSSPSATCLTSQFCVIPSQDVGPTVQITPSSITTGDSSCLYSILNINSFYPQPPTFTVPLAVNTNSLFCPSLAFTNNSTTSSEHVSLCNDSHNLCPNDVGTGSTNSNPIEDSNTINLSSKEIFISEENNVSNKLKDTCTQSVALTNSSLIIKSQNLDSNDFPKGLCARTLEDLHGKFSSSHKQLSQANGMKNVITPNQFDHFLGRNTEHIKENNGMGPASNKRIESIEPSLPCEETKPILTVNNVLSTQSKGSTALVTQSDKDETYCSSASSFDLNSSLKQSTDLMSLGPSKSKHHDVSLKTVEKGQNMCQECGRVFSCAFNFRRHLKVHFGEKAYKCSNCEKSFRYKSNLTVHLRSHTGERPYECSECSKKFRYQTELKEHMRFHTNFKPFSCEDCGQSYLRQRDLKRHSRSHDNERKPTCSICQKSFARLDYLRMHQKIHKQLEDVGVKSFQDQRRSSENVATNQKSTGNKWERDKEPSFQCSLCSLCFTSLKEKRAHQGTCKESLDDQEEIPIKVSAQRPDKYSSQAPTAFADMVNKAANSGDDLISLAFQAAEDGVEFMFMEENCSLPKTTAETQNNHDNVMLVEDHKYRI